MKQSPYIFVLKRHADKERIMLSKRKQESVIKEAVGPIEKVKVVVLGEYSDVRSLLVGRLFLYAELKESMYVVHVNSAWNSSRRRTLNCARYWFGNVLGRTHAVLHQS